MGDCIIEARPLKTVTTRVLNKEMTVTRRVQLEIVLATVQTKWTAESGEFDSRNRSGRADTYPGKEIQWVVSNSTVRILVLFVDTTTLAPSENACCNSKGWVDNSSSGGLIPQ